MPYPRNPNPTPEELEEYTTVDELKSRIDQVTEQRTALVDQYMVMGANEEGEVENRRRLLAEAKDLSVIHQSMLAELANLE